jgi:hypothetical protein
VAAAVRLRCATPLEDAAMIVSKPFAVAALAAALATSSAQPSIEELQWMAGDRVHIGAASETREVWTGPDAGALLGMGMTTGPDGEGSWEQMRIAPLADGRLAFTAMPEGQAETVFPLKSYENRRAVFENPDHDFPQRVIYWDKGEGVVGARIEGEIGGRQRAMEWTFTPR